MTGERIRIPLFPLGMVLFPGLLLPLNIFEERYRTLVRDLLALPEGTPRRFGVIAIRQGREVGADSVEALYEIGTTATVTEIEQLPDGRFEMLTVGTERFRLLDVDHSKPYLQGEIEILANPPEDPADASAMVPQLLTAFRTYISVLGSSRGTTFELPELPAQAHLLSWLIAATVLVDMPVRQRLLEHPDTLTRVTAEIGLLRSETNLLRAMAAAPAPDLVRLPQHPN